MKYNVKYRKMDVLVFYILGSGSCEYIIDMLWWIFFKILYNRIIIF